MSNPTIADGSDSTLLLLKPIPFEGDVFEIKSELYDCRLFNEADKLATAWRFFGVLSDGNSFSASYN